MKSSILLNWLFKCAIPLALAAMPAGRGLQAQSLHINAGAQFIMSGSVNLVLNDMSFVNDGSFTPGNGQVLVTGIRSPSISGKSPSSFFNLTIRKTNNSASLSQNINVAGILAVNRGNLVLNTATIDLGATGSLSGEGSNHSILGPNGGSITALRTLAAAPNALNIGNMGAELTSAINPGTVQVTRKQVQLTLPNSGKSIQRSFDINIPASTTGLNATLRIFYLDTELGGNKEGGLVLWTTNGTSIGRDANDSIKNWVSKSGLNQLGSFTLADSLANAVVIARVAAQPAQKPLFKATAQVYPNPSQGRFNLELTSSQEATVAMSLVDQTGHVLQQKEAFCRAGVNLIAWNMAAYPAGIYYIHFENQAYKDIQIINQ